MEQERIHPDCRDFVATIENLLRRRQQEAERGATALWQYSQVDWPRIWTRTELEDTVYSSYKRMRQGHITRPPRRQTVMEIADYLNCTLEERNRLLIAAHTAPVAPYFTGERLTELLDVVSRIARQLVIPAMIINRDWHIHFFNDQMLALHGVTIAQIEAVPTNQLNFLRLLFDPALPLYPNIIRNRTTWTRMVRQTIYGFKMANVLCQFEPWYEELIESWMDLPEFAEHWRTVNIDVPFEMDASVQGQPASVTVETTFLTGESSFDRTWLRPLVISTGYFQFDFPQIIAFLPADEASQTAFADVGMVGSPNVGGFSTR